MRDYAIYVDSTADLTKELREKYDIKYFKMAISVDGKEYPASLDWDVYSAKELYDWLRNGKKIKTSQVSYVEFREGFEKELKAGKDVLYLSCSSALSGSINFGKNVASELMKEYEGSKILCVDSLISCMGQGLLAIQASENRKNGFTIQENVKWLEDNKLKSNQIASVEKLDYLARAGRVKTTKAFFGNLFGVKPILISDIKGNNYAFTKVKGRNKSIDYLVNFVKENIIDSENQIIYVSHGDDFETAKIIEQKINEAVKCKGVYINYLGPIIGSTTGPGTIGIFFMGKEVTICGE